MLGHIHCTYIAHCRRCMYTNQTWFQEVSCLSELVLHTDVNMYIFLPIVLYILLYVALLRYTLYIVLYMFCSSSTHCFLYRADCPVGGSPQIEKAPVSAASCTFLFFIYLYFVYFRISTNTPSTLVTALVKHCFYLPSTFVEIFALDQSSPAINSRFFQPPSGHSSKSTNMQLPQMRSSETNVLNVHCAVFFNKWSLPVFYTQSQHIVSQGINAL